MPKILHCPTRIDMAAEDYHALRMDQNFDAFCATQTRSTFSLQSRSSSHEEQKGHTIEHMECLLAYEENPIPVAFHKMLGTKDFAFKYQSRWDREKFDEAHPCTFSSEPPVFKDRIKIHGRAWIMPVGPQACDVWYHETIIVKVMGIGGAIETAVEKTMRESLKSLNASALAYLQTQEYRDFMDKSCLHGQKVSQLNGTVELGAACNGTPARNSGDSFTRRTDSFTRRTSGGGGSGRLAALPTSTGGNSLEVSPASPRAPTTTAPAVLAANVDAGVSIVAALLGSSERAPAKAAPPSLGEGVSPLMMAAGETDRLARDSSSPGDRSQAACTSGSPGASSPGAIRQAAANGAGGVEEGQPQQPSSENATPPSLGGVKSLGGRRRRSSSSVASESPYGRIVHAKETPPAPDALQAALAPRAALAQSFGTGAVANGSNSSEPLDFEIMKPSAGAPGFAGTASAPIAVPSTPPAMVDLSRRLSRGALQATTHADAPAYNGGWHSVMGTAPCELRAPSPHGSECGELHSVRGAQTACSTRGSEYGSSGRRRRTRSSRSECGSAASYSASAVSISHVISQAGAGLAETYTGASTSHGIWLETPPPAPPARGPPPPRCRCASVKTVGAAAGRGATPPE